MIPLWVTGDSLARACILADKADFSKHSGVQELRVYCRLCCVCVVLWDGCILFLQLHSRTEPHSMDAISIFHGGGALISTGLRISATRSLHYSPPSLVAGLICVDKGRDGRMWFSLYRSHSTIFIPIVDSGMTSLLHFHLESFIQRRDRRLTST